MAVNCERRIASISAPQSLMLMNSDFVLSHAAALARRLRAETPAELGRAKPGLDPMITRAWQLAYQRPISPEEADWARAFVTAQLDAIGRGGHGTEGEMAVLTSLCQQLLSSNEFLYVD
jgi:hypothetical protein